MDALLTEQTTGQTSSFPESMQLMLTPLESKVPQVTSTNIMQKTSVIKMCLLHTGLRAPDQ